MESKCLRPACLGDLRDLFNCSTRHFLAGNQLHARYHILQALYDAEWIKRGYRRSP